MGNIRFIIMVTYMEIISAVSKRQSTSSQTNKQTINDCFKNGSHTKIFSFHGGLMMDQQFGYCSVEAAAVLINR